MNTTVYLLVLSIAFIVEGSPLPCCCKSGLNSPLESTACSCSKKVVIPAQFTAVKAPPCNCQSGGSQPRPQPIPCIPTPPQTVRPPLQPCIPNQVPYISGGSSPCIPNQVPCIPGGSSPGPIPCIPSGSSSGSQQPCAPSQSSSSGSGSRNSQPCVPIPVNSNSDNCVPVPSIQYTLPSSNKISKKDKDWFEKKDKSQLEDFLDDTKGFFCNKDGGIFGGKTTVCMKWPSWMADMVQKFKCKVDCWSKSHDSREPLIL